MIVPFQLKHVAGGDIVCKLCESKLVGLTYVEVVIVAVLKRRTVFMGSSGLPAFLCCDDLSKSALGRVSDGNSYLSKLIAMGDFAQCWGTLLLAGSAAVKACDCFIGDTLAMQF